MHTCPTKNSQVLLWELGEIEIGLGTLVATNERITQAIEPSIIELSNWVKQTQPNIHVDETEPYIQFHHSLGLPLSVTSMYVVSFFHCRNAFVFFGTLYWAFCHVNYHYLNLRIRCLQFLFSRKCESSRITENIFDFANNSICC